MTDLKNDVWGKMNTKEQEELVKLAKDPEFSKRRRIFYDMVTRLNQKFHEPKKAEIEYGMMSPNKDGVISSGNDYCMLLLQDGHIRIPISNILIKELDLSPYGENDCDWHTIVPIIVKNFANNIIFDL